MKQKTDKELEQIAKDFVFYSEEERLIALNELEYRNSITKEQLKTKNDIKFSIENELGIKNDEIIDKTVSKGKRFLNFLLDMIFICIFTVVFKVILLLLLHVALFFILPEPVQIVPFVDIFLEGKSPLVIALLKDLYKVIPWILYYLLFEGLTGRTLAKYITKTKVVNDKGEKPDFKTILLRTLCRLFPFEPLSFLGSQKTGWHDEWSKTTVVAI